MKRGFLNTDKAKKKSQPLTPTLPTSVSGVTYARTHDISKIDLSKVEKMSYGVLKETGPPEGYNKNQELRITEVNGDNEHPHDMLVCTSLPPHKIGQTLDDIPGGWSECLISGFVKSTVLKTSGFPCPPTQPREQTYKILEVPGMGLGMFAARKLCAGDLILDERPLLIAPTALPVVGLDEIENYTMEQLKQIQLFESEKWLKIAYDRMDPRHQKAYMALANSHLHDGSGPLMGIVRTNGFGISDLKDKETKGRLGVYTGIFNDLSRLNHSCSPNTIRTWYTKSFSMQIRAARDIDEGEEITTNYSLVLDSAANRAADLHPYGIECTCSACSNPEVSDARRERYKNRPVLFPPMALKPGEREDSFLDPAIELLKDMEEDGMQATDAYKATLYQLLNAYVVLNNAEKAHGYAIKLKGTLLANGEQALPYCESLESIHQHPMWMMGKMSKSMGMPVLMSFA